MRIPFAIVFIVILYTTIVPTCNDLKALFNLNSFKSSEVFIDSTTRFAGKIENGLIGFSREFPNKTLHIRYSKYKGLSKKYHVWSSNCCKKVYLSNENNEFPTSALFIRLVINICVIILTLFFSYLLIRSIK